MSISYKYLYRCDSSYTHTYVRTYMHNSIRECKDLLMYVCTYSACTFKHTTRLLTMMTPVINAMVMATLVVTA